MTTLYVAMIKDRHTDPEPFVFATEAEAVAYAKKCAQAYARNPEDVDEEPIDGWLYHASYSVEGDAVWVLAKTIGEAP